LTITESGRFDRDTQDDIEDDLENLSIVGGKKQKQGEPEV
jgi:hypothetical protein